MTKTAKKTTAAAADTLKGQTEAVQGLLNKLVEAGKLSVANTIEVDKLVLNRASESANYVLQHGRSVMGAKDLKTVVELQNAFVQNSFEQGLANTKEILEFTQEKVQEIYAPFKKSA